METSQSNTHATPLPEYLNPQIILFWKAPLRPYKKRAGHVIRFYLAVAVLLSALTIFFGDPILLVPIWSLLFLFYTLTITPPPIVENRITRFGVETAGITMRWEALSHFFFTQRFGYTVLTIVTHAPYSLHAYIVVPTEQIKSEVMAILSEHIMFQDQPQITLSDRVIDWMSKLIPDDEEEEVHAATDAKDSKTTSTSGGSGSSEKSVDSLWEEIKHPMDFFRHLGQKAPEEVKKEAVKNDTAKTTEISTKTEPQEKKEEIPAKKETNEQDITNRLEKEFTPEELSAKNTQKKDVTVAKDSVAFPQTQVPESLLRHISEPNEEALHQS